MNLLLVQWYAWLCAKPESLFHQENEFQMYKPISSYLDVLRKLHQETRAHMEWFIYEGSQSLILHIQSAQRKKGGVIMDESHTAEDMNQKMVQLLEQWYAWLCSTPKPLFNQTDTIQMRNPVLYFHEAINWLSRTTLANTQWFFTDGSQIVMNRWIKGDYNSYE